MKRYEYSEGSSNKYWEISIDGSSVVTHYGRIGSNGQKTLKELGSAEAAKKEAKRLTASKIKKGYVAVSAKKATKKVAKKVAKKEVAKVVAKSRSVAALENLVDLAAEAWTLVGDAKAQQRLYKTFASKSEDFGLAWERMLAIEKASDYDNAQMETYRSLSADPESARALAPYMATLACSNWPNFSLMMVGDWGDARAVPTVRAGLDKAEYGRGPFVSCLAAIDDDAAYLAKLAKNLEGSERNAIIIALARCGDEKMKRELVKTFTAWIATRRKMILSGVTGSRVYDIGLADDELIRALGELKLEKAVPALIEALETTAAIPALEALGAIGDRSAADPIAAYLSRLSGSPQRNRGYRLAAENALSRLGRPQPLDAARGAIEWAYPKRYGYPKLLEAIGMRAMAAEAILERGKREEIERVVVPLATSYFNQLRQVGARAYLKLHGEPIALNWYDEVAVKRLTASLSKKQLLARLDDPRGMFRGNIATALFGNGKTAEVDKVVAWCRKQLESTLNYRTDYASDIDDIHGICFALLKRLPAKRRAELLQGSSSRWIRTYLLDEDDVDYATEPTPPLPLSATLHRFDGVPFIFGKPIHGIALAPDGSALAAVGQGFGAIVDPDEGSVSVWLDSGHGRDCCFSPDGQRLAVACSDGQVRLFDVQSGEQLFAVRHHRAEVCSVVFSTNGKLLTSAGQDDQVVLMRAASGDKVRAIGGDGGNFTRVAFLPDGKRFLAAHAKKRYLLVIEAANGKKKQIKLKQEVWAIAIRRSDGLIALGTKGHEVLLYDASFKALGKLKQTGVRRLLFSRDEELVAMSESGEINRFAIPDKIVRKNLPAPELIGEGDEPLRAMAFHPDSAMLYAGGDPGTVERWREDGTSPGLGEGETHTNQVKAVCLRPDGSAVTSGWDGRLLLWPPEGGGGELLFHHDSRLEEAFLTPDAKRVVVIGREQAFLIDIATRKELARWPTSGEQPIRSMALSPKGTVVALGIGYSVGFFSLPDFAPIGEPIRAAGDTINALWCLDNRRVLAGAEDGLVSLVDVKKGVIWTLGDHGRDLIEGEPHGNPHKDVAGIAVDHEAKLLATGATDNSVRIYELSKGAKPPVLLQRALLNYSLFSGLAFVKDRVAATTNELDMIDARSGELLLHLDRAAFGGAEATRFAVRSPTQLLIGTESGAIFEVQITPA